MSRMKYLAVLLIGISLTSYSQHKSSRIFSHNDYLQDKPFESAYSLNVGYVEADVFLREEELMVAHTGVEIKRDRTLKTLYLDPIKNKIKQNKGNIYHEALQHLTLMIDLKTEGISTLNSIVKELNKYPELTECKTLTIAISGNVPDTAQWKNFPAFITFDGRPERKYSEKHLKRVSFISNSFSSYSSWKGIGQIPNEDVQKLKSVIASVHSQGKTIRFWGAPDVPTAWKTFIELGVDILGTDRIKDLSSFLKEGK
jgi:alkaline phosphatase